MGDTAGTEDKGPSLGSPTSTQEQDSQKKAMESPSKRCQTAGPTQMVRRRGGEAHGRSRVFGPQEEYESREGRGTPVVWSPMCLERLQLAGN